MTESDAEEPMDVLTQEIVTHSIEEFIYSFQDSCPSISTVIHHYIDAFDPRSHFQMVLEDLIRVTHCHGCGDKNNVCFFGYVGEYCSKKCMKSYSYDEEYYDTESEDYDEDSDRLPHSAVFCVWCDSEQCHGPSRANTLYHSRYYRGRYDKDVFWPMLSYHLACENECIRDCPTVCIPGYNDGYHPPLST